MTSGTPKQYAAADPQSSVWVGASAGTGKTKVLTDRVLRLLLSGVSPERILCITFTKAGAMEMASRINRRLARWAILDDLALAEEVADLGDIPPYEADIRTARKLFARVLDTPEALRIETIHAFCQSVLRRFPLEAGISPHFEVLDDLSADEILDKAQRAMIARIRNGGATPSSTSGLAAVSAFTNEEGFSDILRALLADRGRLSETKAKHGGIAHMRRTMAKTLGLEPSATLEHVSACLCASVDDAALKAACTLLDGGSDADQKRANAIRAWLAEKDRSTSLDAYIALFLTMEGAARKTLATKTCAAALPALQQEQERLRQGLQALKAARCLEASCGLLHLADEILHDYARTKKARALLDYDDLILATRTLLTRSGSADWVLFKLDGGFDHILVDEAQDTNPDQWEVIRNLAGEYFAGLGARDKPRTLFVVGDIKQSIFSFQKADPTCFNHMRDHFRTRACAAEKPWREIPLEESFRSVPAVLAAVDAVFAQPDAAKGVAGDALIHHTSRRMGQAGSAEIWPLLTQNPDEDPDHPGPPPAEQLAIRIAQTIRTWLDDGTSLPARGRPILPGDILILVRHRGPFFTRVIRALRHAGVPVAGADRMLLGSQLPVMDMLSIIKVLLLPEDDLTLAAVLKSAPMGLSEETLFSLAHNRQNSSLWERLGASRSPDAMAARSWLESLRARADFIPPYEVLESILSSPCPADPSGCGRRAFLRRLGSESTDALDELLEKALAFERLNPPSLEEFVLWMEGGPCEIKRDMDEGRLNEVRIMTVHGSKGLQAPIVFLPDTTSQPRFTNQLIWTEDGLPLWVPPALRDQETLAPYIASLKSKADDEYRRLLYVAMTRAADRLIICGASRRDAAPGCWHSLVHTGLAAIASPFPCGDGLEGLRLETPQTAAPKTESPPQPAAPPVPLPDFFSQPAPEEPRPARPIAPSRPAEEEPACLSPLATGEDDSAKFQRGLIIHKLLQTLPDVPPEKRKDLCRTFLASPAHGFSPARAQAIGDEVLALMARPDLAFLFGKDSMAEVPISGRISDSLVISGQIDRIAITPDAIFIVDYKTNRPPARDPSETPAAYLRQMAAYRAALRRIHPGRRITCALLWTNTCHLMPLPDDLLDSHAP
ncbi:MAG TPA: double-strand break repair helicase AddA [Rhodospirillaceae bacterium]|nr:MAG: double-strand break repair helicase AddA [Alphaproteobacteria bacterium GWF2_58_20]HAU28567.1 double-strand break repair helicase AddA [Rhodospirillaceae bacterium]